jgi:hypothetical protein
VQPSKLASSNTTPGGMNTFLNKVHSVKLPPHMDVTPSGTSNDIRLLQQNNACGAIEWMVAGKRTIFNDSHRRNQSLTNKFNESGK